MTQAQIVKALQGNPQLMAALGLNQLKKDGKAVKRTKAEMLAAKDKAIRSTFTKRGVKDVVLMDRTDPTKAFNVRPYKGWLEQGRRVRKGEKAVRGLFHVSQTDEVEAAE